MALVASQQQKIRCGSSCRLRSSFSFIPHVKCHLLTCFCFGFLDSAVPQIANPPFSQSAVLQSAEGKPSLSTVTTVSPPVLTQQQVPPQQQPQVQPPGPPAPNQQPPQAPQPQPTNQQTPPPSQPGMVSLDNTTSYLDTFSAHRSFRNIVFFQPAVPAPQAGAQQGVANKIVAWSGVLEWQEVRNLYGCLQCLKREFSQKFKFGHRLLTLDE